MYCTYRGGFAPRIGTVQNTQAPPEFFSKFLTLPQIISTSLAKQKGNILYKNCMITAVLVLRYRLYRLWQTKLFSEALLIVDVVQVMSALKLWLTVTLATKTLSDRFGRFRTVSDRFRTVSDLFGRFRTVFGLFRTVSDRFRTVSDRFGSFSDRFGPFSDRFGSFSDR